MPEPEEEKGQPFSQRGLTMLQGLSAFVGICAAVVPVAISTSTRLSLVEWQVQKNGQNSEWITNTNQRLTIVEEAMKASQQDRLEIRKQVNDLHRMVQDIRESTIRIESSLSKQGR